MERVLRMGINLGITGAIVLGGYVLMQYTTPSKEEMLKRLPSDLADPDKLSETNKNNELLFQVMQRNIKSSDPIWKVKGLEDPWKKPTDNSVSTPAFSKD